MAGKVRYWFVAQNILFGILMVLGGNILWETGWDSKHGMPVYNWVGLLFMGAGLPFIGYGCWKLFRPGEPLEQAMANFICPECESVYALPEGEEHRCPNDGTPMEPLDGYYDRHPERRDKPITPNKA